MRPGKDEYFLNMTRLVASRSTCLRRAVGCVLINHRGHVLATGYNGVPAGAPHCNQPDDTLTPAPGLSYPHACAGAEEASGVGLDGCDAIHAEQNALLQCGDVFEIETAYVTTAPCVTCTKLLLNTGCRRIVCLDDYAASGEDRWRKAGREWIRMQPNGVEYAHRA